MRRPVLAAAAWLVACGADVPLDERQVPWKTTVRIEGASAYVPDEADAVWMLESRPAGSRAELDRPRGSRPSFYADMVGTYELVLRSSFEATSAAHRRIRVRAVDAELSVTLLAPSQADVGDVVPLEADVDGPVNGELTVAWEVVSAPLGSGATVEVSENPLAASLALDESGDYLVKVTVTDVLSGEASAEALIRTDVTSAWTVLPDVPHYSLPLHALVGQDGPELFVHDIAMRRTSTAPLEGVLVGLSLEGDRAITTQFGGAGDPATLRIYGLDPIELLDEVAVDLNGNVLGLVDQRLFHAGGAGTHALHMLDLVGSEDTELDTTAGFGYLRLTPDGERLYGGAFIEGHRARRWNIAVDPPDRDGVVDIVAGPPFVFYEDSTHSIQRTGAILALAEATTDDLEPVGSIAEAVETATHSSERGAIAAQLLTGPGGSLDGMVLVDDTTLDVITPIMAPQHAGGLFQRPSILHFTADGDQLVIVVPRPANSDAEYAIIDVP